MNCPKCKSENVVEGTAGTLRCADCDYPFVPYNTAPRLLGASQPAKQSSPVGAIVAALLLVFLILAIAVALGFVSPIVAGCIFTAGLLIGIFICLVKLLSR